MVFWSTLEASREKTVYFHELVMIFKVVHIVISDNFYSDHKAVRSNLTELFYLQLLITPRGCFRGGPGWKFFGAGSGDIQHGLKYLFTNLYNSSFKITGYPYQCFDSRLTRSGSGRTAARCRNGRRCPGWGCRGLRPSGGGAPGGTGGCWGGNGRNATCKRHQDENLTLDVREIWS